MPKSQIHALLLLRGARAVAPRGPRSVLAYVLALSSVSAVVALGACASAPPQRVETVHQLSPSEEAEAIEAAKRHPIATTYERPQARTEGDLPVAPPRIPAPPPGAEAQASEAPPPPRDQVIIVGNEPAPAASAPAAPEYRWPDTSSPEYVDYADSPYVWVDGAWVARPGRVYVETPWVGVGVGRPWGYGRYGYDHGYSYPPPYYRRPPVIVVPSSPSWHSPRNRYHDSGRPRSWGYQSSPRREVYVAPRATESRSISPARPVYRAPAVAPRSSGSVHRAPAVAPRSSGSVHRAPSAAPRSSGSSGGRRSVHVR